MKTLYSSIALLLLATMHQDGIAGGEVASMPVQTTTQHYVPPPAVAPPQLGEQCTEAAPRGSGIEKSKIGPSARIGRNMPMPAPHRPMGWGAQFNEKYGPTYYHPFEHNVYEGLHPQYYPFYHPTQWPNYKAPGDYCRGKLCGPSRSSHYWDSYDDWKRGGRYEQHQ